MSNRIILNSETCCGCAACANICSQKAITLDVDNKGFIVPRIDEDKCIDCGMCIKFCDFKKTKILDNNTIHAYSLTINDKNSLYASTSGGAFSVISDYVLSSGGLIVGSVMEDDFTVHHVVTSDVSIRNRMKGSKYVQSDICDIYSQIGDALKDNRLVLFTGTPCQCAAIRSFYKGKYSNLIVVDFLCHGVPSNDMFKEHISFLERYYGQKLTSYSFRDKKYGWNAYNNNINTEDGKIHSKWINQVYHNFFVANLSLRDACYNCPYRSFHRPSDITIADFWGIEKLTGKKNYDGVSLVLTHSEIGELIIQYARSVSMVAEYPWDKISYRVAQKAAPKHKKYDLFWDVYRQKGYDGLVSLFFDNSLKNRIRYEVRKIAKRLKLN